MWYYFYQNNSGGQCLIIEAGTEYEHLMIEADDYTEANTIADKHIELDTAVCDCCGDNFTSFSAYNIEHYGYDRYIKKELDPRYRNKYVKVVSKQLKGN